MTFNRDPEKTEIHYLYTIGDPTNATVLEVGCGDGRLTWRYAADTHRVIAIDPDPLRLEAALEARPASLQSTTHFLHGQSEQLPFPDQTFNRVILAWSL